MIICSLIITLVSINLVFLQNNLHQFCDEIKTTKIKYAVSLGPVKYFLIPRQDNIPNYDYWPFYDEKSTKLDGQIGEKNDFSLPIVPGLIIIISRLSQLINSFKLGYSTIICSDYKGDCDEIGCQFKSLEVILMNKQQTKAWITYHNTFEFDGRRIKAIDDFNYTINNDNFRFEHGASLRKKDLIFQIKDNGLLAIYNDLTDQVIYPISTQIENFGPLFEYQNQMYSIHKSDKNILYHVTDILWKKKQIKATEMVC